MGKIKDTISQWIKWWQDDPLDSFSQVKKAQHIINLAKILTAVNIILMIGHIWLSLQ
jgi:hypothetical protein